ncbi:4Fe-4S binding protein [Streptomyces rubiginosohelvolus]|uniref:4Fe-4S binding protein n=1 Tax=Streptomyces rubiginosohelvolus TaxID=67362 RepID=UPI003659281B
MALTITEDCINCGACEPECPTEAITEARQPPTTTPVTSGSEPFRSRARRRAEARPPVVKRSFADWQAARPMNPCDPGVHGGANPIGSDGDC